MYPEWEDVREDWLPNDGLRDIFITDDTEKDWRTLVAWIDSRPDWETTYTEDGEIVGLPDVGEIMSRSETRSVRWAISIGEGINVHAYLWPDDAHFDLDPREITGPRQFARVCDFIQSVGQAVGKRVEVWAEGSRWTGYEDGVVTAFDPTTGLWLHREGL